MIRGRVFDEESIRIIWFNGFSSSKQQDKKYHGRAVIHTGYGSLWRFV